MSPVISGRNLVLVICDIVNLGIPASAAIATFTVVQRRGTNMPDCFAAVTSDCAGVLPALGRCAIDHMRRHAQRDVRWQVANLQNVRPDFIFAAWYPVFKVWRFLANFQNV